MEQPRKRAARRPSARRRRRCRRCLPRLPHELSIDAKTPADRGAWGREEPCQRHTVSLTELGSTGAHGYLRCRSHAAAGLMRMVALSRWLGLGIPSKRCLRGRGHRRSRCEMGCARTDSVTPRRSLRFAGACMHLGCATGWRAGRCLRSHGRQIGLHACTRGDVRRRLVLARLPCAFLVSSKQRLILGPKLARNNARDA